MESSEAILVEELGAIFGEDCAKTMISMEKNKGKNSKELMVGLRRVLVQAGGEKYAEMIFQRLGSKIGGELDG